MKKYAFSVLGVLTLICCWCFAPNLWRGEKADDDVPSQLASTYDYNPSVQSLLGSSGNAQLADGRNFGWTAKVEATWSRSPGEENWSISTWHTKSLKTTVTSVPVFVDVLADALTDDAIYSLAVAVVDIDSDGYDDVFVAMQHGRNLLLRNTHDGTFEECPHNLGSTRPEAARQRFLPILITTAPPICFLGAPVIEGNIWLTTLAHSKTEQMI